MLINATSSLRGWHNVVVSRVEEIATNDLQGTLLRVHLVGDDLPFTPWFQINPKHTHFSSEFFEALNIEGEVDSDSFVGRELSVNLDRVITGKGRKIWGVVGYRSTDQMAGAKVKEHYSQREEQSEMLEVDLSDEPA